MRWIPLVIAGLCLGACGQDYCERAAASAEDCGESVSDSDVEACQEALESCSPDDRDLLNEFYDCAEERGLLECDSGTPSSTATTTGAATEELEAVFACLVPLSGLSEACADGGFYFGSGGSTGTYTFSTGSVSR